MHQACVHLTVKLLFSKSSQNLRCERIIMFFRKYFCSCLSAIHCFKNLRNVWKHNKIRWSKLVAPLQNCWLLKDKCKALPKQSRRCKFYGRMYVQLTFYIQSNLKKEILFVCLFYIYKNWTLLYTLRVFWPLAPEPNF